MDVVADFAGALEHLERERQKVQRDRHAFVFLVSLLLFLSFLLLASAAIGHAVFPVIFGVFLLILGLGSTGPMRNVGWKYQVIFRDKVTRPWFHRRFQGVFLAAPPAEITPETRFLLEGANLDASHLEDRVFFDRESEDSHVYLIKKGRKRFLCFMKKREGAAASSADDFIASLRRFGAVKAKSTPEGLWVLLRLEKRLFPAPVLAPTKDPVTYSEWEQDAKILLDPDLRLAWIGAR